MMTTMAETLAVDDNPADLHLTVDALAQSLWRLTVSEWVSAVKVLNEFWIGCACLPREVEP